MKGLPYTKFGSTAENRPYNLVCIISSTGKSFCYDYMLLSNYVTGFGQNKPQNSSPASVTPSYFLIHFKKFDEGSTIYNVWK